MSELHKLVSELRAMGEDVLVMEEEPAIAEMGRQAAAALDDAAWIIAKVGTTGIEYEHQNAECWLKKYFPERL